MDREHLTDQSGEGQPGQDPTNSAVGTGKELAAPDSSAREIPGSPQVQSILPPGTQQLLRELAYLPGQLLPPETVYHLKNAGRESVLAVYSLWQNINRATNSTSGEKVRKHIEVE
jgi:hypothetical protein